MGFEFIPYEEYMTHENIIEVIILFGIFVDFVSEIKISHNIVEKQLINIMKIYLKGWFVIDAVPALSTFATWHY